MSVRFTKKLKEERLERTRSKKEFKSTIPSTNPLCGAYISTNQFAEVVQTSPIVIRESRVSGMLFGRPAPQYRKIGTRKVVYEVAEVKKWIEDAPLQRVVGG